MRLRRPLSTLRLRLRSVFRRARVEQELDDEIRDHIDRRVAADVARGVSREQARQAALRAFGGIEQAKEACRDVRRVNVIEHTVQDLRFAARHFARAPMVTATMIGIFALGIGFSAALFLFVRSFVNGPVPGIGRQESLVRIRGIDRTRPGRAIGREFSYPEYREYAAQPALFSDVAAWTSSDVVFDVSTARGEPAERRRDLRHRQLFPGAGSSPDARRGPPDGRQRRRPDAAACRRDQPRAVGETLRALAGRDRPHDKVNGVTVTIVGVAPRRFAGARTGRSQMRVWLPLSTRPQVQRTIDAHQLRRRTPWPRGATAARCARRPRRGRWSRRSPHGRRNRRRRRQVWPRTDVVPLLANNYFPPSGEDERTGAGPEIALIFPISSC